jgi:hypothetical protein
MKWLMAVFAFLLEINLGQRRCLQPSSVSTSCFGAFSCHDLLGQAVFLPTCESAANLRAREHWVMLRRIVAEPSPTIEAFRAIVRHPRLALAEVSWRWTFGAAGSALVLFTVLEYLDSLLVTTGDALFLKTRHPLLVSQALGHMIAGSGERLVAAGILVSLTLGGFWIVASSVGRAATIRPLLQYFSGTQLTPPDFTNEQLYARPMRWRHLRSLAALNFLRLTLVLAGLLALVSSGILSSFISTAKDPQPGLAFLIFIPLALLVVLSWSSMNWILSIAPFFVLRDECDVFGAFASAVNFCLDRAGAVSWSSTIFGICHFVAFAIASSVVVFPLAFVGLVPGVIVATAIAILTLLYFAVVDFLYVARLAAYVCILQMPKRPISVAAATLPPYVRQESALQTPLPSTDSEASVRSTASWPAIPSSDDDILSDIPLPPSDPPQESK